MDLKQKRELFEKVQDRRKNLNWQDRLIELYPEYRALGTKICKNITFVVTQDCNLRCTYCYMTHKNSSNDMTLNQAKDIIDFLLDREKMRPYINIEETPFVILEFIGGEPLLKTELMIEIMRYWKIRAWELDHPWATNYRISISTNGLLYNSDLFRQFLFENYDRVSCTITIDGTKELHDSCRVDPSGKGSYDRVISNVPLWIAENPYPSTKLTIAHENIDYLADSVIDLFKKGIDVSANCVYENVWSKGDNIRLYNQLIELADRMIDEEYYLYHFCTFFDEKLGGRVTEDRNYCGGDGSMLAVDSTGTLYPCIRYMRYSMSTGREGLSIGHIDRGWDLKAIKELSGITFSSQSPSKCMECKISAGCGWCSGLNYDLYGTPNKRSTFICNMHRVRVLANKYYWDMVSEDLQNPELEMKSELTDKEMEDLLNEID